MFYVQTLAEELIYSIVLCYRVVDFKGAQLEYYRILIGVHAKVLLDPKDLKT